MIARETEERPLLCPWCLAHAVHPERTPDPVDLVIAEPELDAPDEGGEA